MRGPVWRALHQPYALTLFERATDGNFAFGQTVSHRIFAEPRGLSTQIVVNSTSTVYCLSSWINVPTRFDFNFFFRRCFNLLDVLIYRGSRVLGIRQLCFKKQIHAVRSKKHSRYSVHDHGVFPKNPIRKQLPVAFTRKPRNMAILCTDNTLL